MGREFVAMSPHRGMGEFDQAAVGRMFATMIEADACIVLISGRGFIGGMLMPIYFCPDKVMAEEHFLWSRNGSGRSLVKAFELVAKKHGASFAYVSTLENDKADTASRFMQLIGYTPIERRYLKELT